jgi:hypothetical protein
MHRFYIAGDTVIIATVVTILQIYRIGMNLVANQTEMNQLTKCWELNGHMRGKRAYVLK